MEFVLDHWAATLFLPAILVGLAILVLIIRATERR